VVPVDDCLITHPAAVSLVESSWSGEPAASHENTEQVRDHRFRVASDGFWQPHRDAPALLVDAVLDALDPQPGESCMDLYAGVGLFARFLADRVGEAGDVFAVEADRNAVRLARSNLAGVSGATVIRGRVDAVLKDPRTPSDVDLVVLDPPRTGAKRALVGAIASRAPRAVAYVACDPAALARDVATFAEHGYRLSGLRAFDLFPMTHHVECLALLEA
jgi:tRNA/tmRNA/rRNA uracil-C5-methylase (TrmA/RlmC/RlmD family)